jgi:hypothetical protein
MSNKLPTKDLSINNAQAFITAIESEDGRDTKNSTVLYAAIGNVDPYENEPTPSQPVDSRQYLQYETHRKMVGAKKINPEDVSHVTLRNDWVPGTVYSMYRDQDINLYDRPFYVMTNEYNVYKCLFNNEGAPSTVKPSGFSTLPFTTSDGYTWKYMYTISLGDASKFLTKVHMPVKTLKLSDGTIESDRQVAVQQSAVNGSIEVVEVDDSGVEYLQVTNGVVDAGGKFSIRLSGGSGVDASPLDNIYNGSSVYIISGTGSGQLRRIIDYSGSTKTLVVNTAFATVPNTDSRVIISPTVTVIGDGFGAKAYSRVDENGGVANVSIIDSGQNYTRAQALISSNVVNGSGATANVIISPVGGHGSDPIRELGGDKVALNVQFASKEGLSANGNGYIPSNTEFRTISILKDPILKVDANNNHVQTETIANTSNSPETLRMTSRLTISYNQMNGDDPVNELEVRDTITNERVRLRAELGELEFVTELSPTQRRFDSLANAVKGANADVAYVRKDETEPDPSFYTVYINNVESYSNKPVFVKDDVILKSTSETEIATVEQIKGPEANTFSGEILFTENIAVVTRDLEQQEDFKIILDF